MTTIVEFFVPEKSRSNTITQLSKHFPDGTCKKIEKGFYDFTKQYCVSNGNLVEMAAAIYSDHVANFLYNCGTNNKTIRTIKENITKKKFNPYNIAFLKPEELDMDNWSKIISRMELTEKKLKNLPTIEWKKCFACKNDQYFWYQLQTRSADEPMTTFYECKQCGKTYKVNN